MNEKYTLKLYIAGLTPDTQDMIANFKSVLSTELQDSYSLEVIDVLKRPELAANEKILATPTVVRLLPGAAKKFVLDLASKEKILIGLDLIKKMSE